MNKLQKGLFIYSLTFVYLIIAIVFSILYSKNHCQPNDDECEKKDKDYKIILIVFWVLFLFLPTITSYYDKGMLVRNLWKKYNIIIS